MGYKKKIDENNGKYDNDITLYNHFYYSTEDDEDEFVRIELDDNTKEHKIGKEIEDKYGELRTVSSRERNITEGLYNVISAQIKESEALNVLNVSASTAKANFSDLGNTTKLITSILNCV